MPSAATCGRWARWRCGSSTTRPAPRKRRPAIYQTAADGKPYTPPDSYERLAALNRHLFHTPGHYITRAPVGPFKIEVTRGFEYEIATTTVDVRPGSTNNVTVRMKRMVDFGARGWQSGSNHVHMNYAGNLHNTPENMLMMARAEDMGMTSLQVANKDNRVLDYQHYTPGQALHPLSKDGYVMHVGRNTGRRSTGTFRSST